jgi:hypothetical protein
MRDAGQIQAAALFLRGQEITVGQGNPGLVAAERERQSA